MRRSLLLFVLAAVACSRGPSGAQAYDRAWAEFRQGKLPQAQQTVNAALKNHEGAQPGEAWTPLRLLQIEILLARGQKASSLLDQVPDPREQDLHLRWLVDRADILRRQNRLEKATELLDEVDGIAGSKAKTEWAFRSLLLRSNVLMSAGRLDEADQCLASLLLRTEEAGDDYNRASTLLNLSFSKLKRKSYDELIDYARQSLDLAGTIHAARIVGAANNNLGIAYTVFHELDQAAEYTNKAIAQFTEIDDRGDLGDAFGELGNIHLIGRNLDLAVQDFEHAFEIAKSMEDTVAAARWAGRLAFAQIERKDWNAAESWNGQAYAWRERLKAAGKEPYLQLNAAAIANGRGDFQKAEALYRDLIRESTGVPYVEWDAHLRLGALFASQKKNHEANAEYVSGLQAIERVQASFLKDDERLSYHDLQMEFFKDYVDLLVSEGDTTGALKVVEYSRARVLAEKLAVKPEAIGKVGLERFQSYARRTGSVLLSFWLAPQRSFAWVIKPEGIRMRILPPGNEIGDLIRDYGKAIDEQQRDPVGDRLPLAERLSKALLGPLRADLAGATKIVVVPDEQIHSLNLETLPALADPSRYWIEEVEIAVAPSLSVLAGAAPRSPMPGSPALKSRAKPSLLLVGAPVSAGRQYPALPGAAAEIDEIHRRFPSAVLLTGAAASPRGFLDAMPAGYSMIHFAAHGETNSQSPLESAVILSRNGDNYKLYARDITKLNLCADLVTLSACRSAGARAYGGEGLVGFAWAFLHAGAQSVIAGLWDVSDSSSSQLMDKLYESLASHVPPATALRQAKRSLLQPNGPYRRPYFWAPYQIYIQ